MAIKGSLREASLADVCQLLSLGLKTGCLAITDRGRFGEVYFERGRITYARIVNRKDRLGSTLVRSGAITKEQLETVAEQRERGPDASIADLLLTAGLVDEETVGRFVRQQVEETIFHLFTWSQGTFFFEADREPDPTCVRVSVAADSVLLEAARRTDEWSLIENDIPSLQLIFEPDQGALDGLDSAPTPVQAEILELLDGERSLEQVVDETGLSEFEVGTAVHELLKKGLVHERGHRAQTGDDDSELRERRNLGHAFYQAGMLADARAAFQRALELDPADVDARFHVALVSLREGQFQVAAAELRALIEQAGPHYGAFTNLALALRRLGRNRDALLVLDEAERVKPDAPAVALARAAIRLDERRIGEARQELAEYRSRLGDGEPAVGVYYYMAGLASALLGEAEQAETISQAGLEAHPESPPMHLLAGLLAERRGDSDSAEGHYRRAVDIDPRLVQAHKSLGDVAYARGAHDRALQRYQRAAELDPELGDDVYARLGDLHYRARNREGAIRHWRTALEMNPGNQAVRNNLEIVTHAPT